MNGLISNFYSQQRSLEYNGMIQGSALVGFALEANYDSFVISTSTSLQNTAGYLTRGSFLLAMGEPERAVLLRVQEVASSPLRSLETMTTYELSKRSMPELDRHTKTEMSWHCVRCDVLGTYYEYGSQVLFSGDMDRLLAPTDYRVFTAYNLLELVVNGVYYADKAGIYRALEYAGLQSWGFVSFDGFCSIGTFRPTELFDGNSCHMVNLYLSDIAGRRTALFGKTRSGKSNTVKMIAAALIRQNISAQNLGQLIIDTNGEYANDNPQDGLCLYSRFPGECVVYAVNVKPGSSAHILRCNFYRMPGQAMAIFQEKLREKPGLATYVSAFLAVPVESLEVCSALLPGGERTRAIRRIQMLWAALYAAGFPANEAALTSSAPSLSARQSPFDPGLSTGLREAIHGQPVPSAPTSLHELFAELEALNRFRKQHPDSRLLQTASGNPLLDPDDLAVLNFLFPNMGSSGVKALSCCRYLHDANAGDFLKEIPDLLDQSRTVILDLSNASPALIEFLTGQVCAKVFHHQEDLFTQNALGSHYVQLYAEEAHNYFPAQDTDTGIFARIAKEGAKYNMGLVYSTQSPSTISGELLSQTENFFVAHLDSVHEVDALVRRSAPFTGVGANILKTRTPGYVHLLTASQRYPIPVQIANFHDVGVV